MRFSPNFLKTAQKRTDKHRQNLRISVLGVFFIKQVENKGIADKAWKNIFAQ